MRPGRCVLPVGMFELRPHGIALQHHAEDAAEPGLAVGLECCLEDRAAIGADGLACGDRADERAVVLLAARTAAAGGDQHQQKVGVGTCGQRAQCISLAVFTRLDAGALIGLVTFDIDPFKTADQFKTTLLLKPAGCDIAAIVLPRAEVVGAFVVLAADIDRTAYIFGATNILILSAAGRKS